VVLVEKESESNSGYAADPTLYCSKKGLQKCSIASPQYRPLCSAIYNDPSILSCLDIFQYVWGFIKKVKTLCISREMVKVSSQADAADPRCFAATKAKDIEEVKCFGAPPQLPGIFLLQHSGRGHT
jgi:hypothetical protein